MRRPRQPWRSAARRRARLAPAAALLLAAACCTCTAAPAPAAPVWGGASGAGSSVDSSIGMSLLPRVFWQRAADQAQSPAQHSGLSTAARSSAAAQPAGGGAGAAGQQQRQQGQQQRQQGERARRPIVVAHRGASGMLPEHTAAAYELAIEQGADFIECDVQLTADLQMICRHEQNLNATTDAAEKFPGRAAAHVIDGEKSAGVHAADLTLAELRTLRARQRFGFRDGGFDGRYSLVTFEEFLDIAARAPRNVGVYPEVKHPTWHNALPQARAANTTIQALMLAALHARGYNNPLGSAAWGRRPVYIQSFEATCLRQMAAATQIPLVLLLGGWPGYTAPDTRLTHEQMTSPGALAEVAGYASGVGPWKGSLVTHEGAGDGAQVAGAAGVGQHSSGGGGSSNGRQGHGSGGASGLSADAAADASEHSGGGGRGRLVSTGLVARLQSLGLQVHPYTLRDESRFLAAGLETIDQELHLMFDQEGVDGVFADFPGTAVRWLAARHGRQGSSGGGGRGRSIGGGSVEPLLS